MKAGIAGLLMLGLVAVSRPVRADPIVITGGSIGMVNGLDLPGFTLTGSNSAFTGIVSIAGVVCCVFSAGDTVMLNASFPLGSLPSQPSAQTVNGTAFPHPFVAPPNAGPTFSFSTPFTAQGQIAGFENFGTPGQTPLFSVELVGSGTATVAGNSRSGDPNFIGQRLTFQFEAPAATPEPVSLVLFGSGAVAVALAARRRKRDGNSRR
jgi:hypothetical protein